MCKMCAMKKKMKKLKNIQTFEEYTKEIKQHFWDLSFNLLEKEVDDYFNTDEVKNKLERDYARDFKKLQSGEIKQDVFDIGCTSSVAYCLFYMY